MNTKNTFGKEIEKLKGHLSVKGSIRAIAIALNALAGIIIGVYFRNIPLIEGNPQNNFKWIVIAIFFVAIFIYLNFWIFYSDSSDKIEFLDRIKHKDELKRQKDLNDFLLNGLNEVNTQTCNTYLCKDPCDEKTFIERLTNITTPLKEFIESEYKSKVSIGIHLNGFEKIENGKLTKENRIFHLHSDLGVSKEIPVDLLNGELKDKQGFQKYIFTNLTNIIHDENIVLNYDLCSSTNEFPTAIQKEFASLFSYIPDLCTQKEPTCNGGLYILTTSENHLGNDLFTFFKLYGWFIASYIDQYNQCINGRLLKKPDDN